LGADFLPPGQLVRPAVLNRARHVSAIGE